MKTSHYNSPEVAVIRQRMQEVRRDLDEDVQQIVEGARDMGKWRSYVTSYPWLCAGAALAAGYLIVPRRAAANPSPLVAVSGTTTKAAAPSLVRAIVSNLVMRGIVAYVGQQADRLFATRTATQSPQDEQP